MRDCDWLTQSEIPSRPLKLPRLPVTPYLPLKRSISVEPCMIPHELHGGTFLFHADIYHHLYWWYCSKVRVESIWGNFKKMRRQSQIDMGGPKKIVGKEKNIASKTTNIAGKKEIILQAKNKKYCRHISRVSVRGEDGKPHICLLYTSDAADE